MKKFINSLLLLVLSIIVIAYLMEWVYTYSYKNVPEKNARNKVSWLEVKDSLVNYDYALFGSSRCIYHVNPVIIDERTGMNGINLGYSSSNAFEIKLMVKKFLDKYQPSKIFIQVDDRFNLEHSDPISVVSWMPFINDDYVYQEIHRYDSKAYYFKHLPFYRYTQYETSLGFRNVFFSYFKENSFHKNKGFTELRSEVQEVSSGVYVLKDQPNKHLEEIEQWCRERKIELYFFTSPYLKKDMNTDVLEKYLSNYHDFSQVFTDRKLFKDGKHLNWKGAEKFTNLFVNHYFK